MQDSRYVSIITVLQEFKMQETFQSNIWIQHRKSIGRAYEFEKRQTKIPMDWGIPLEFCMIIILGYPIYPLFQMATQEKKILQSPNPTKFLYQYFAPKGTKS